MIFFNFLAIFFYIFIIGPIAVFTKIKNFFFLKKKKTFWKTNKIITIKN
tara:strand:+ start:455 stop:601 length:147 start_codon:yes stop_codon:yes gene_type:complete